MEGTDDQQLPLFTTFIDFKKAFDSKATCMSILLYGSEGWTLTKKLEDKLNS